ncbi:hypothetical protein BGZ47_009754 [Haplosporangium gracile]|nr:hypothetical protein BGZ47_009754 [Haplosporangium gracile]
MVILGDSLPHQFVSLGSSKENPDQAIKLHISTVSDTGNHVLPIDAELSAPRRIKTPYVHTAFSAKSRPTDIEFGYANLVSIDISSCGSKITLSSVAEGPDTIPFTVYQTVLAAPADKGLSGASSLKKKSSICKGLVGFVGQGLFYRPNYTGSNGSESDEATITGNNNNLYFSMEISPWQMLCFQMRLRGRYFARNGSYGVVSVYDITTADVVSHIYLSDDSSPPQAAFNEDGSKIAIIVNGIVQIHDTHSGIKLGTYKDNLPGHNQIELAFEKDYLLVVNSTLLFTSTKTIC